MKPIRLLLFNFFVGIFITTFFANSCLKSRKIGATDLDSGPGASFNLAHEQQLREIAASLLRTNTSVEFRNVFIGHLEDLQKLKDPANDSWLSKLLKINLTNDGQVTTFLFDLGFSVDVAKQVAIEVAGSQPGKEDKTLDQELKERLKKAIKQSSTLVRMEYRLASLAVSILRKISYLFSFFSPGIQDWVNQKIHKQGLEFAINQIKAGKVDSHFEKLQTDLKGYLSDFKIEELTGGSISSKLGMDAIKMPDSIKVMQTLLMDYFDRIDEAKKRSMAAGIMELEVSGDKRLTIPRMAVAALKEAGPGLIKLFQFLGDTIRFEAQSMQDHLNRDVELWTLKNEISEHQDEITKRTEAIRLLSESAGEMKVLKGSLEPMTAKRAREIMVREFGIAELYPDPKNWRVFDLAEEAKIKAAGEKVYLANFGNEMPKRLAAASVGDVFTILKGGEEVIIKVLKDGIRDKFAEEVKIFGEIFDDWLKPENRGSLREKVKGVLGEVPVSDEVLTSFVKDAQKKMMGTVLPSVKAELSLYGDIDPYTGKPGEAAAVDFAHKLYTHETADKSIITSLRRIVLDGENHKKGYRNILIENKAPGEGLEKFIASKSEQIERNGASKESLQSVKTIVGDWHKLWLYTALFSSESQGFFHADGHSGNLYIEEMVDGRLRLTVIDLGANGFLASGRGEGLRTAAKIFGIGLKEKDPISIVKGIGKMLADDAEGQAKLKIDKNLVTLEVAQVFADLEDEIKGATDQAKELVSLGTTNPKYMNAEATVAATWPAYQQTKFVTDNIANILTKYGINPPDEFVQFFRGSAFGEQNIEKANDLIAEWNNKSANLKIEGVDLDKIQTAVATFKPLDLIRGLADFQRLKSTISVGKAFLNLKYQQWRGTLPTYRDYIKQSQPFIDVDGKLNLEGLRKLRWH